MDISHREETTQANEGKQRGQTVSKGQPVWSKTGGREGFGQWTPKTLHSMDGTGQREAQVRNNSLIA